ITNATSGLIELGNTNFTKLYKGSAADCGGTNKDGSGTNGGFGSVATPSNVLISSVPNAPDASTACPLTYTAATSNRDVNAYYVYAGFTSATATATAAGTATGFRIFFCVEQSVGSLGAGVHYYDSALGLR
ncbi:MAG TPA: hypothetical protein VEA59_01165, partial [Patescibacteria group bacterium]|nr:hypothetical protein [Patescibacteria group bacterium]